MNVWSQEEFVDGIKDLDYEDLKRDGLVLVWDKPSGPTSHDVVNQVRGMLIRRFGAPSYKKLGLKVGHAGTLDPLATGVLIILIGKATKYQAEYMGQEKEYVTEAVLGVVSDTYDIQGQISKVKNQRELSQQQGVRSKELGASRSTEQRGEQKTADSRHGGVANTLRLDSTTLPDYGTSYNSYMADTYELKNKIQDVLNSKFTGMISQKVPAYSAVKIGGQKLYDMARGGNIEEDLLPERVVEIKEVEVEEVSKILVKSGKWKVENDQKSKIREPLVQSGRGDLRFKTSIYAADYVETSTAKKVSADKQGVSEQQGVISRELVARRNTEQQRKQNSGDNRQEVQGTKDKIQNEKMSGVPEAMPGIYDGSFPLVRLRVVCGKGTYIRSLVHDLGRELGTGAVVYSLRRVRVGEFF